MSIAIDAEVTRLDLLDMTTRVATAAISAGIIGSGMIGEMIRDTFTALEQAGNVPTPLEVVPAPAVTKRASLANPDYIVSMLDGKPYKMLKRHLSERGHTPESYRELFGLPADYPMVAPSYSAKRRQLALDIGLGVGGKGRPRKGGA